MGIDIQDDQGRHEVGMVENTIKTPLGLGQEGCLFESVFHINKVTNYNFLGFPPHFSTFFQYFLFSRSQNNDKDRRGSSGSRQSPTVSGHNMNNDSDRDRNNRGPGGRDHGQNKVTISN